MQYRLLLRQQHLQRRGDAVNLLQVITKAAATVDAGSDNVLTMHTIHMAA